ncbi:hypothetical protein WA026_022587, partial [Henosepilachna vigintioctopunctata]
REGGKSVPLITLQSVVLLMEQFLLCREILKSQPQETILNTILFTIYVNNILLSQREGGKSVPLITLQSVVLLLEQFSLCRKILESQLQETIFSFRRMEVRSLSNFRCSKNAQ